MCIRDFWRVDCRPLAKASASYKQALDVEHFTRRTFLLRNLIFSVGKEHSRFSVSGVPCQYCSQFVPQIQERSAASSTR